MISARTKIKFREFLVNFSIREISNLFDAEGIQPVESMFSGSGQRRKLVEDYYAGIDFSKPIEANKILRVYESILIPLKTANSSEFQFLFSWLESDGYVFKDNKLVEKSKDDVVQPEEVSHIWEEEKVRVFVSHRDKHKKEVREMCDRLSLRGFSCFVAHESILPMTTWKNEIMKALQTMDACICYITNDFYESEWTNQEVGYAISKGVPIFLYSADKTDPKGFLLDIQAVKSGEKSLVDCLQQRFPDIPFIKKRSLELFEDAKDGSYNHAKEMFMHLLNLSFTNKDIDFIVSSFLAKATYSNQLKAVLSDPIKIEHKSHPKLKNFEFYRDFLNEVIFPQHTLRKLEIKEVKPHCFRIYDNGKEVI
jgi:nucleoside 2-deoxyribosyltransferase